MKRQGTGHLRSLPAHKKKNVSSLEKTPKRPKHFALQTDETEEELNNRTVFVSRLDKTVNPDVIRFQLQNHDLPLPQDIRHPASHTKITKPYAYLTFESAAEADKVVSMDEKILYNGRKWRLQISRPTKELFEKNTAYVYGSSLDKVDSTTAENHIRKALSSLWPTAEVKDIRVREKEGVCRGYAYVDIENVVSLLNEEIDIKGYDISIRRSVPLKEHRWHVADKVPARILQEQKLVQPTLYKDTIVVKNLSFKISEEEITEFFESNVGKIAKLELVRDETTGKSKGFCFIQFEDEKEAEDSTLYDESTELDGRPMNIRFSHRRLTNKQRSGGEREKKVANDGTLSSVLTVLKTERESSTQKPVGPPQRISVSEQDGSVVKTVTATNQDLRKKMLGLL